MKTMSRILILLGLLVALNSEETPNDVETVVGYQELKFVNKHLQNFHQTRDHPDTNLTTPEMIERRGYPAEIHYITTADHYILQMHRIPNPGKPVVFLQHGILGASSDWHTSCSMPGMTYGWAMPVEIFTRGIILSSILTPIPTFGDSHELDYVLALTGEQQVTYIGHSMGTTMFWIMCSEKPKYNTKIKQMHALSPMALIIKVESPIRFMAPYIFDESLVQSMMGLDEFMPSNEFFEFMGVSGCRQTVMMSADVCDNILFLMAGYDSQQLNETTLPVILSHTPADTSTESLLHYVQGISTWNFEFYDYSNSDNNDIYGNSDPPDFNLKKITSPVYLHWSDGDWFAHPDDVASLNSTLLNVKASIRVPLDAFNHLDFLWAMDVRSLLYDTILDLMENPL
ncbi:hypothetical protein B566_EDAN002291 [Ephemera danica]|nr:hypothetical protein B566_EDAN002291 [Ephemera danica]